MKARILNVKAEQDMHRHESFDGRSHAVAGHRRVIIEVEVLEPTMGEARSAQDDMTAIQNAMTEGNYIVDVRSVPLLSPDNPFGLRIEPAPMRVPAPIETNHPAKGSW